MSEKRTYRKLRRVLVIGGWSLLALGCVVVLVAAIRRQNNALCSGIEIDIEGTGNFFIDKSEIRALLTDNGKRKLVGFPMEGISIRRLEARIEKSPWVKNAELFFDNNHVLQVKVEEREPVARVFTTGGESFYMDTAGARLPLSDHFASRLPVFTSFPSDKKKLTQADSLLLGQISVVSQYLAAHTFWMQMVQQLDITADRQFELVPTIGDHIVRLGDTSLLDNKFSKLFIFYKQVLQQVGWNKYAALDVRYGQQVIGVRRDAQMPVTDTSRANAMLQALLSQSKAAMQDTLIRVTQAPRNLAVNIDSSLSMEPGADSGVPTSNIVRNQPTRVKPPEKPVTIVRHAPPVSKPKPVPAKQASSTTPRAVMPKRLH